MSDFFFFLKEIVILISWFMNLSSKNYWEILCKMLEIWEETKVSFWKYHGIHILKHVVENKKILFSYS